MFIGPVFSLNVHRLFSIWDTFRQKKLLYLSPFFRMSNSTNSEKILVYLSLWMGRHPQILLFNSFEKKNESRFVGFGCRFKAGVNQSNLLSHSILFFFLSNQRRCFNFKNAEWEVNFSASVWVKRLDSAHSYIRPF